VTERVQLACSVAIAGVRSPFETAFAALDLDRLSSGRSCWPRLEHALGHAQPFRRRLPEAGPAAARVRRRVRHIVATRIAGSRPSRANTSAPTSRSRPDTASVRAAIPIWLGALRSRMTRLAGEIADGVIAIRSGASTTGSVPSSAISPPAREKPDGASRSPSCVYLTIAIADDPRVAFADARQSVAAYAAIEQYAPFFEDAGFGDAAARIRRLWAADQRERAAQEVDETMARAFGSSATPSMRGVRSRASHRSPRPSRSRRRAGGSAETDRGLHGADRPGVLRGRLTIRGESREPILLVPDAGPSARNDGQPDHEAISAQMRPPKRLPIRRPRMATGPRVRGRARAKRTRSGREHRARARPVGVGNEPFFFVSIASEARREPHPHAGTSRFADRASHPSRHAVGARSSGRPGARERRDPFEQRAWTRRPTLR